MSTHRQVAEIKKMWWCQQAEINRLKRIHSPLHWLVVVWNKGKKRVECIKCNKVIINENDVRCNGTD
jgi:hypothetical protein